MSVTVESLVLVNEEHGARANSEAQAWCSPCSAFARKCCTQAGSDRSLISAQLDSEVALLSSALEKKEFPLYQWIAMQSQSVGSNLLADVSPWKN